MPKENLSLLGGGGGSSGWRGATNEVGGGGRWMNLAIVCSSVAALMCTTAIISQDWLTTAPKDGTEASVGLYLICTAAEKDFQETLCFSLKAANAAEIKAKYGLVLSDSLSKKLGAVKVGLYCSVACILIAAIAGSIGSRKSSKVAAAASVVLLGSAAIATFASVGSFGAAQSFLADDSGAVIPHSLAYGFAFGLAAGCLLVVAALATAYHWRQNNPATTLVEHTGWIPSV
eukprot:gene10152-31538_t